MYCNRSETIPCAKWFPALKLKFRVTLLWVYVYLSFQFK
jgi:hypothetical protein